MIICYLHGKVDTCAVHVYCLMAVQLTDNWWYERTDKPIPIAPHQLRWQGTKIIVLTDDSDDSCVPAFRGSSNMAVLCDALILGRLSHIFIQGWLGVNLFSLRINHLSEKSTHWVNSLAPGRCGCKHKLVIFNSLVQNQILATKIGVFFVIFVIYVQCGPNNNVIKYRGWGVPHNWDMSFGKFGGLPTLVAFPEN